MHAPTKTESAQVHLHSLEIPVEHIEEKTRSGVVYQGFARAAKPELKQ
jgi:hypothetical protein